MIYNTAEFLTMCVLSYLRSASYKWKNLPQKQELVMIDNLAKCRYSFEKRDIVYVYVVFFQVTPNPYPI